MKKLLLSTALLAGSLLASAQLSFDYEQASETIYPFGDNVEPITVSIINNPVAGGINTSTKVVSYHTTDGRWCGFKQRIASMDVAETKGKYKYLVVKFYQPVACPSDKVQKIRLKLLGSWMDLSVKAINEAIESGTLPEGSSMDDEAIWTWGTGEQGQEFAFEGSEENGESPRNYTAGEWMELKYDISSLNINMFPDGKIYGFAIEPTNGAGVVGDYTCYIDDVNFQLDPEQDVTVPPTAYKWDVLDNFEAARKPWFGLDEIPFEIVDNPLPGDALNNSAKVMKVTRPAASTNWVGVILPDLAINFSTKTIEGYRYAHVKVYKENAGAMNFKVEGGPAGAAYESAQVPYTPNDKWQNMVFDLTAAARGEYTKAFIMVDRTDPLANDIIVYLDDIKLSNTAAIEGDPSNVNENTLLRNIHITAEGLIINLDSESNVAIEAYNTIGQKVSTIYNGQLQSSLFPLTDLANGIYIITVQVDGKIVALKYIR